MSIWRYEDKPTVILLTIMLIALCIILAFNLGYERSNKEKYEAMHESYCEGYHDGMARYESIVSDYMARLDELIQKAEGIWEE